MIQFGPAHLFGRARRLACGPVSPGTMLLTCGAVAEGTLETVQKSLVLAMLADFRQRQIETVEAFCLENNKGQEPGACSYFSSDFLRDCGFYPVRSTRGLKLMRLELGGTAPAKPKPKHARGLLERIKSRSAAPAPVAMAEALTTCSIPACSQDG
jgi:hypothetical protein